jgi:ABC-type sugar transport system ATPase subunit
MVEVDVGEALLKVRGLYKSFGAVEALTAVELDVPAGQGTALCELS